MRANPERAVAWSAMIALVEAKYATEDRVRAKNRRNQERLAKASAAGKRTAKSRVLASLGDD